MIGGVQACGRKASCGLHQLADQVHGMCRDELVLASHQAACFRPQGSSLLTARSNVDNFGHLTTTQSAAVAPLFADPQVCEGPRCCGCKPWVAQAGAGSPLVRSLRDKRQP